MITITIDDAGIVAALNKLASKTANLGPVMREIGTVVRNDALDNFKGQHSPDGTPWKKLSPATLMARAHRLTKGKTHKKDGSLTKKAESVVTTAKILLDTGALRNSISVLHSDATSAVIGTKIPYASMHQFGVPRRIAPIPARPFLGISSNADRKIMDLIADHMEL